MSDLISREAVIDWLTDRADLYDSVGHIKDKEEVRKEIEGYLTEIPSVTPKQRTGHWILTIDDWNKWTCSECGFNKRTDIHVNLGYDYCPNCGANMESEVSDGNGL